MTDSARAYHSAREARDEARENLDQAITAFKRAEERLQQTELRLCEEPSDAVRHLTSVAYSNRAEWSGGTTSVSNICESIKREVAIGELNRISRKL